MTADDLDLLRDVAIGGDGERVGELVDVQVTGCAFSCCGRGWRRRDGYEQVYRGQIQNLDDTPPATFMVFCQGVGSMGGVAAVREWEVIDVMPSSQRASALPLS